VLVSAAAVVAPLLTERSERSGDARFERSETVPNARFLEMGGVMQTGVTPRPSMLGGLRARGGAGGRDSSGLGTRGHC